MGRSSALLRNVCYPDVRWRRGPTHGWICGHEDRPRTRPIAEMSAAVLLFTFHGERNPTDTVNLYREATRISSNSFYSLQLHIYVTFNYKNKFSPLLFTLYFVSLPTYVMDVHGLRTQEAKTDTASVDNYVKIQDQFLNILNWSENNIYPPPIQQRHQFQQMQPSSSVQKERASTIKLFYKKINENETKWVVKQCNFSVLREET